MNTALPDDLSCDELVERCTDYLEGTLAVDGRTRLEMHLVLCPGCTSYLRQMRDLTRLASRLSPPRSAAPPRAVLLEAFRRLKASGG